MFLKSVIVVLGCKIVQCDNPTPMMKGRVDALIKIENPHIIILSGGYTNPHCNISEAFMMKNYMEKNNYNMNNVILEERSMDTIGNAVYSKILLSEMNTKYDNITLITSCFHMNRASNIFKYIFKDKNIIKGPCSPWDIDYSQVESEKWIKDKKFLDANKDFSDIVRSLQSSNRD